MTVVVPHIPSREGFFRSEVLPAIERNGPVEIFTQAQEGTENASTLRNRGAARGTQPYLFFCDDDVVLRDYCLATLCRALEKDPKAAFAYCDVEHKVHPGIEFPAPDGFVRIAGPFDPGRLKGGNYISTMSLIRQSAFPGWDECLEKHEDWDLWLRIVGARNYGIYIPEPLFVSHHIDRGLMLRRPESWAFEVRKKHGIGSF
jgi:hypothetical protein